MGWKPGQAEVGGFGSLGGGIAFMAGRAVEVVVVVELLVVAVSASLAFRTGCSGSDGGGAAGFFIPVAGRKKWQGQGDKENCYGDDFRCRHDEKLVLAGLVVPRKGMACCLPVIASCDELFTLSAVG